ncbi:MAG: alanine racemase, partial [Blastocatellia bacterium]|nr:alanine racemase [Blastocatellia bacterium]
MRPTWAEVRLDRIVTNYKIIKDFVGSGVEVMAVVKANAYGHGAVQVAMSLEKQARADWFGVALVEEGIILRRAGVRGKILCLGGFWQDGLAKDCVDYDLTPTIYRLDMLDALQRTALSSNQKVKYHVKLDT